MLTCSIPMAEDAERARRPALRRADLVEIRHHIERRYAERLTLCGLARCAGMSKSRLVTFFRDSVERWQAFPDLVTALGQLAGRCRLMAMTDAQRWAYDHFARTLGSPFRESVTVDEALCEKSDPNFFGFARSRISRSVFGRDEIPPVAPSRYRCIGIARVPGYATCWIGRPRGQKGPCGTVSVESLTRPCFHFPTLVGLLDEVGP